MIENGQEYFKYNDDGEPSNTAGKPMAEILNILDVYNIAMVATRYFGGIKLGAGGLIRNYAKTAKLALQEAEIVEYIEKYVLIISYDYSKTSEMDAFIANNNIEILEKSYTDKVTLKVNVTKEERNKLENINIMIIEI